MIRFARMLSTLAIAALAQAVAPAADDLFGGRVNSLETSAITARASIRSGHVSMDDHGRNAQGDYAVTYDVYFNERYLRADVTQDYPEPVPAAARSPKFTFTYIRGPDRSYDYTDKVLPDGKVFVLQVDDTDDKSRGIWCVPDVRLFGMSPSHSNSFASFHLDSFLGSPRRKSFRIADETYLGQRCSVISYDHEGIGVAVKEWICPSRGYSVLRMTDTFDSDGVHFVDDCKTDVEFSNASKVWFPSTMEYTRTENGETTNWDKVAVHAELLNQKIPENKLVIASMNVPAHTPVMYNYKKAGQYEWDGKKIAKVSWTFPAPIDDGLGRFRWMLIAANLFVLAAVFAIWLRWKKRLIASRR